MEQHLFSQYSIQAVLCQYLSFEDIAIFFSTLRIPTPTCPIPVFDEIDQTYRILPGHNPTTILIYRLSQKFGLKNSLLSVARVPVSPVLDLNLTESAISLLIQLEPQVKTIDWSGQLLLDIAAEQGKDDLIIALLNTCSDIIDINAFNEDADQLHPFGAIIMFCKKETILAFISAGLDIKILDQLHEPPLGYALEDIEKMKLLLAAGASPNGSEPGNNTVLHQAILNDRNDAALLLIESGANVDTVTLAGWTPLMYAARRNNHFIIRKLLEAGANINETGRQGQTVLMMAIRESDIETIRLLLEMGANPNIVDANGETARVLARRNQLSQIVDLLIQAGAQ